MDSHFLSSPNKKKREDKERRKRQNSYCGEEHLSKSLKNPIVGRHTWARKWPGKPRKDLGKSECESKEKMAEMTHGRV